MADSGTFVPDGFATEDPRDIGSRFDELRGAALRNPKATSELLERYRAFSRDESDPAAPGATIEVVATVDRLVVAGRLHVITEHEERLDAALRQHHAGLKVIERDERIGVTLAGTDLDLDTLGRLVHDLRTTPSGEEPLGVGFDDVTYEAVVIAKPITPQGAGVDVIRVKHQSSRPHGTGRGAGVTVGVIDGGFAADDAPPRTDGWFDNVKSPADGSPKLNQADPALLDPGAGHGTFVTGIIAAHAPDAMIVQYRATDSWGFGSAWRLKDQILQAVADGCQVINISLGFEDTTLIGSPGISAALHTVPDDVLVVAAAGNSGSSTPMLPASHKATVGVGGLDLDHDPVGWSNRGPWVDFSALAVPVLSTFVVDPADPGGDPNPFGYWAGTSFAAPKVSGELAVLLGAGRTPATALTELRARGIRRAPSPDFGTLLDLPDQFR
ncbi:MAG: S8/S53 family peptidase [Actinobacteria bacterium]|nr:S8/S53 family peptidase [Actinomycetota bacterium]